MDFSTRSKDAGIAILYCRIWKWHGGGWHPGARQVVPKQNTYFFVIEKYIEDARQDEKHIMDLLEAIMTPPGIVKEELRQILLNMI